MRLVPNGRDRTKATESRYIHFRPFSFFFLASVAFGQSYLRDRHIHDGAPRRVVVVGIRARKHRIQESRRRRIAVNLLLAVRTDRVPLVQDVGARRAKLVNQRVRVGDGADGVVDGLVREHGHLRRAVEAHGAVLVDDAGHLGARQHLLAVGEVPVDVLELVGLLSLAQRVVLCREEVRGGVGANGGGCQLAVDVLLGGRPLAQKADDGRLKER